MARKRKELPEINNVEISGVAAEGMSLARINDMVVFIPFGAPGDVVDIKLTKKKKSYAEGRVLRTIESSPIRVKPMCEHFTKCGGCKWQHLPYSFQLQCKQQQVVDALQRIAKVKLPEISTIIGSEEISSYRNKLEYTFSNKRWLTFEQLESGEEFDRDAAGFHIPGAFDKVLDINNCHLQEDISNKLRLFIKRYAKEHDLSFYDLRAQQGFLRTMIVRTATTGEKMLIVVFGENNIDAINNLLEAVKQEFPELTSIQYVINLKVNDTIADQEVILFSGSPFINEEMDGLKFRISPKSFYQTNSRQAYRLYSVAREMADLNGDELVYDLYTGTGTIANFIARNAKKVIGIEYVEDAIADARINSEINNINNTLFYAGDMKNVLTDAFIAEHGRPDVMIIDPPRAGMHEDVVNVILNAEPKTLVYVSCNPATQARDIALLDSKYKVVKVQPVDMFPHTHHVENVVKMELRN